MQTYLSGKKTYVVAIAAIISLVYGALVASNFSLKGMWAVMDWPHLMEAIGAITLRAGIAKAA